MPPGWYGGYYHPNTHYIYGARCRFFPRLFWFALGAGAYAYWSRCDERHRSLAGHNGEWRHWSNSHWGCHRPRDQLQQQRQQQQQGWNAPSVPAQPTQQPVASPVAPAPPTTPVTEQVRPPAPAYSPSSAEQNSTEWQTERFREASKQASETVSEMSEKAIDALMANLQTLKAKITEARETRERDRSHYERRNDKQGPGDNSPPGRLV